MSDEKDWEEMCRRLVRWDENRMRSEGNNTEDLVLKMEIREDDSWGRWDDPWGRWIVKIVFGNEVVLRSHRGKEKKQALLRMVWSYAFRHKFLDLDMRNYEEDLENPGIYEELDLKLSSFGF